MNKPEDPASELTGRPVDSGAEDCALVEKCLAGEAQAFEQLFTKYRQRIFAVCWRIVGDEDAALDVVQDTFVRAYEQLEHLKGEARFYPWLRRIAVNLAIDWLRQQKRDAAVSLSAGTGTDDEQESLAAGLGDKQAWHDPERAAEASEFNTALAKALLSLSENHRAVFMLHAAEGMSYKEIAEALDCNIGTVMSRLFYARKRLQELLAPHLREG